MAKWMFQENCYIKAIQTSPEDALADAAYPASGSYLDVSGYEYTTVLFHLGAVNAGDTPNVHLKCTDSVSGTLDSISATALSKEWANDDDDQWLVIDLKNDCLPTDHHFVTLDVNDVANASYGTGFFILHGARHLPVTQDTTYCPSDNQLSYTS